MGYTSIVVGTDGSATAERAVAAAAELAVATGAKLAVVSAFERHDRSPSAGGSELDEVPADIRYTLTDRNQAEDKAKAGRAIAQQAGASGVTIVADEGAPVEVLLTAATDHAADLVVVGSKGMTGASRFVLGSVANDVSHHAPCDVLVVHTTE